MRVSEDRTKLLRKLKQELYVNSGKPNDKYKAGQPDTLFALFGDTVQQSAGAIFAGSLASCSESYRAHAAERKEPLRRRSAAVSLNRAVSKAEDEQIKSSLRACSKHCSKLRGRQMRKRRADVTEESDAAWRKRHVKEVDRLMRALACRRRGPRRRSFHHIQAAAPTASEWLEVW